MPACRHSLLRLDLLGRGLSKAGAAEADHRGELWDGGFRKSFAFPLDGLAPRG
jgi:hypothetical protein